MDRRIGYSQPHFQHILSHLIFVPAPSRLQFSSVTAFYLRHPHAPAARREGHGADRPPPPRPHRRSPPLHLRLPPPLNEFKQAGIHQQSNVEFFQMRMGQKDPAIALVAAQFLKGHSFLRKD